MIIGVPKEIKDGEFRVSITPANVAKLVSNNHKVLIETNAGIAGGFSDEDYKAAGAEIVSNMEDVYKNSQFILKVKESYLKNLIYYKKNTLL